MNIKEIKISELHAYTNNAKTHDEKQIGMIAESIKQFGFRQPLVIDKNNEIVVGHGRYFAAKKLGLLTVPCEYADDLTDDQIKAYRLADNKLNESPWDFDLVDAELASISDEFDLDMSAFGFNINDEFADIKADDFGEDFELRDTESDYHQKSFIFSTEQLAIIEQAMESVKDELAETYGNTNKSGNELFTVVVQWAEQKKSK